MAEIPVVRPDGLTKKTNKKQATETEDSKTQESEKTLGALQGFIDRAIDKLEKTTTTASNGIKKATEGMLNVTEKNLEQAVKIGLGPMALLAQPLQDLTGKDFVKSITGTIFKPVRKNVSASDVAKKGDSGSLLIFNLLRKQNGSAEGKEGDSSIMGLFGGAGGIMSKIATAIPIVALIAGLVWMAIDGIMASFKSGEWGVSKISAVIGGVLGGTGSGWKNAFKNGGKWALVGAGTGFLIGGPIGALIGGLAGAVIGGLMGFFGGEKIAKGVEKAKGFLGNLFKNLWNNDIFKQFLMTLPPVAMVFYTIDAFKDIMAIWKSKDNSIASKIGKTLGRVWKYGLEMTMGYMIEPLKLLWMGVKEFFVGGNAKKAGKFIGKLAKNLATFIFDSLTTIIGAIKGFFKDLPKNTIRLLGNLFRGGVELVKKGSKLVDMILPIAQDFIRGLLSGLVGEKNAKKIESLFDKYIYKPIQGLFGLVGNVLKWGFDMISKFPMPKGMKEGLVDLLKFFDFKADEESGGGGPKKHPVDDAIISNGEIIVPSSDDTIIATKNPISTIQGGTGGQDGSVSMGAVEGLLKELIVAVRQSKTEVTVPQNFDKYRNPIMTEY